MEDFSKKNEKNPLTLHLYNCYQSYHDHHENTKINFMPQIS